MGEDACEAAGRLWDDDADCVGWYGLGVEGVGRGGEAFKNGVESEDRYASISSRFNGIEGSCSRNRHSIIEAQCNTLCSVW